LLCLFLCISIEWQFLGNGLEMWVCFAVVQD